jgi:hypothetical protein
VRGPVPETIKRLLGRIAEITFALFCLVLVHLGLNAAGRLIRRGVANVTSAAVRPPLRRVLTVYYRRKVTKATQEQPWQDGLPPHENPHLE